ncbi:-glutamine gamma-glutamyltransferase 5 isoform X1 [Pelobates cultripes]|uniref:protein-glutamine gamma-glutamyltransferase n=1 Tax=Pelobates cultripes TaxID=61616 RepID=A0AAD1SKM7_PELCU|nr:-glutamine gamma-glutamyltransferase 5 isoform X1 [Pelobates cultripes]
MADAMCAGAGERECTLAGSGATNWVSGQEPKGPEELKLLTLDTATPQATTYQPTTRNSPQANSGGGRAQAIRAAEPAHTAPDLPPPETANLATDQGTPTARPTTFIGGHNSGLIQQPTVSHSTQTSVLTGAHLGKSRRGTQGQPEKQPKRYQRATQQHSRRGAARTPALENTRSRPHGPAEPKSPGTQTNLRTLFQPALEISFSDFHTQINNAAHRTNEISDRRLIIRRGQPFSLSLHFKTRGFQKGDNLIFIVETGPWPDEASGTRAAFPLARAVTKSWSAALEENKFDSMAIAMSTSPNAIIGQYTMKLQITTGSKSTSYQLGTFTLLFNPWCVDDEVYMENQVERQEYVLNDYGFVYQGNSNWITPCPWNFGQFEDDILDITLKLLDKNLNYLNDAFKDLSHRNSAVYVSRVVCAMINSNDDNGVLQGNWSEDYTSGVCPSSWNGSTAILRQWYKSDCQPVKYGQCWVFAAIMCTVMRGLGIPTRVITNFESAHDTNTNILIDEYYDSTGKKLPKESHDSIWNFHVWCECWMARRDLPSGFGGWQVLDPTPQETSDGKYCCGPASVKAIKEGEVNLSYDGPFVFAMVNADCVSWLVYGKRREKYFCDPHLVGNRISTKRAGSDDREDVTHHYKYQEESPLRRELTGAAGKTLTQLTRPYRNLLYGEAEFKVVLMLTESPQLGQTINLALLAVNLVRVAKTLKLSLTAQSVKHNGKEAHQFWKESMYIDLGPGEEKWMLLQIPYTKYGPYLDDNYLVRVTATGEQNITWEKLLVQKDINLALPNILINFLGSPVVNKPCRVKLTFSNPLNEEIQDCLMVIEGSGLLKSQMKLQLGAMKPREKSVLEFQVIPFKVGFKQLQVNFSSNKFRVIKGYKTVSVKP